ncbi:MAG: hypothetical protein V1778_02660 [bacterium]
MEFQHIYHTPIFARTLVSTDAIVVLSGRVVTIRGQVTSKERENRSRIRFAASLQQRIANARQDSARRGHRRRAPQLYLVGTTEQVHDLGEIAVMVGCIGKPVTLDCGCIGQANTKTQFMAINAHLPSSTHHITIVTSRYHVPRVVRTADRWLPASMQFFVTGAPEGIKKIDIEGILLREFDRILEYGERDDLRVFPKRTGAALTKGQEPDYL